MLVQELWLQSNGSWIRFRATSTLVQQMITRCSSNKRTCRRQKNWFFEKTCHWSLSVLHFQAECVWRLLHHSNHCHWCDCLTETANLINQHSKILMGLAQHAGHKHFAANLAWYALIHAVPFTCSDINLSASDPDKAVFFSQVHSSILAKSIENVLSPLGFQDLPLQKDQFYFRDATTGEVQYVRPIVLKIILS